MTLITAPCPLPVHCFCLQQAGPPENSVIEDVTYAASQSGEQVKESVLTSPAPYVVIHRKVG